MEDDLRRGLIVTCIGDRGEAPMQDISGLLAQRFGIAEESMELRRLSESELLLLLPDEVTAVRVFDGGRPVVSPSLRLHLARWTRLFRSAGAALPQAVDVELRGIPAHAWDVETAALLLDECCLITGVEHDAGARRDVLHVRACAVFFKFGAPSAASCCWRPSPSTVATPASSPRRRFVARALRQLRLDNWRFPRPRALSPGAADPIGGYCRGATPDVSCFSIGRRPFGGSVGDYSVSPSRDGACGSLRGAPSVPSARRPKHPLDLSSSVC
ncbi:hypothetical protein BAE44_0002706 [Dichanthelium oligosanthes]|uniref:DUF4283 domain-containing protein n=1 Tax=Dichanthelium oligosanthes TaxID=888268 RepID=A0A1E5WFW2_9POAL|nr:hypothetical protein BAE44_0002706 [Dichanthelium oligosanthes]